MDDQILNLKNYLYSHQTSQLLDQYKIESLLINAWDSLQGLSEQSMSAEKLVGRIEELKWEPPILSFLIERHGGTVKGSSRAELHECSVDVVEGAVIISKGQFRNLKPRGKKVNTKNLANDIFGKISQRIVCQEIEIQGDTVQINISSIAGLDNSVVQQTRTSRRKKFRIEIAKLLIENKFVLLHELNLRFRYPTQWQGGTKSNSNHSEVIEY